MIYEITQRSKNHKHTQIQFIFALMILYAFFLQNSDL